MSDAREGDVLLVRLMYSCPPCGLKRVGCEVPARQAGEDVLAWLGMVMTAISADHRRRSPACGSDRVFDLMIPMTGTDRIGGPVVQ